MRALNTKKSENATSVNERERYIDNWLRIDRNASTTRNLTVSEIADTVLNRTADHARSSSKDEY